jgi:hypothetical protein
MYDSTNDQLKHIKTVNDVIKIITNKLADRGLVHDKSKFSDIEKEAFDEYVPKLKETTYGSDEYNKYLEELGVALQHHYENNRHHPEHFKGDISKMNLIDLIEMFCDWKAATLKHADGDFTKSILFNQERFNISEQLTSIFLNTVDLVSDINHQGEDK